MAKIEHIKNKRGEVIYPVSKEGAIYDENGVLLSTKIATFITRLVDNLANYYLKSETYTKGEVDELIGAIQGFTYIVVSELPTASAETMGIVYLVPSEDPQTQNVKDEYITIRSGVEGSYTYSWEQIGSTAIDLSGYVTTEALNNALADYTTTANLTTLLAAKQDTIADLPTIRSGAAAGATAYQKPGTGIPATDMASGVQTSLGKADSAYQKPSGGIPKTDLESGVQDSLELADSAVQAEPIGSIVPPVDPSEFATKEEVEELEAKVTDNISAQRGGFLDLNLEVGYYKDDLSVQANPNYNRAKIDVSSFKKIAVTAVVNNPIHIILTDESGNILWQGGDGYWYRDIDLTAYPGAKYFYLSNTITFVPTPSVYVYGLDGEVSDIDGTLFKKETVGATEAGYINTNGIIQGLTGTWKHTKLYPVSQFNGVDGGLVQNGSVAEIAFFSGNEINQQNFVGYFDCTGSMSVEKFRSIIPSTAKYFSISTNYDNGNVLLLNIKADALEKIEQINGQVEQLAEDTTALDERMDAVEETINGSQTTETETTQYSLPGYIKRSDGTVDGTSSTWIHSDLIPLSKFVKAGIFVSHSVVANAAYYSANEISAANFISFEAFAIGSEQTKEGLTIPEGAEYVAFSTNGANYALNVTTEETIVTPGLSEKVADLETEAAGLDNRVTILENGADKTLPTKTLHFSFDDTISAFYDIVHNNRASIFDNAFFGALKSLHETYGAVFSCYCFLDYIITKYVSKISTITTPDTSAVYYLSAQDGEFAPGWYVYKNGSWTSFDDVSRSDYVLFSLSSFPSTFASEFSANAKWLKFGLHCKDGMSNYGSATAEEAATDYNSFITSILAITGTPECVDTVVRLQNFSGALNACRGLRDADLGVQGFLCADYSETGGGSGGMNQGYYLTNSDASAVWKKGQIYDYSERLHFYMSALRIDNTTGANMPAYMATFLTPARWEQTAMIEMYAHENQMFNASSGTVGSDYIVRFTAICTWAKNNGFVFGYQMDKIRMAF